MEEKRKCCIAYSFVGMNLITLIFIKLNIKIHKRQSQSCFLLTVNRFEFSLYPLLFIIIEPCLLFCLLVLRADQQSNRLYETRRKHTNRVNLDVNICIFL